MKTKLLKLTCGLALLGAAASTSAQAQSFYPSINTNTYPDGLYSSIIVDNKFDNGITATYTVSTGNFRIQTFNGAFANVNGPVIFNSTEGASFDASFSSDLTDFIINFAADGNIGSTTVNVSGYENGTLIGTQSFSSAVPTGYQYDEGQIDFASVTGFNSIVVSLGTPPNIALLWAIGSDANGTGTLPAPAPTPEPSTLALAGLGGLGLLWQLRRRK